MIFFKKKTKENELLKILPQTKGEYFPDYPLADLTWLKVGGNAEVLYLPQDEEDIIKFLKEKPHNVPYTILGGGSNVLIRDGGVPGVVIKLSDGHFNKFEVNQEKFEIKCEAGLYNAKIGKIAQENQIGGFEFLSTIPGKVGGTLRTNASCYGREMKDILVSATVIDGFGDKYEVDTADFQLSYRNSLFPKDWIITSVLLRGYKEDKDIIKNKIEEFQQKRKETQPIQEKTAGSAFKNPTGLKAWQLIEKAGCKNLKIGGAEVSDKHSNFLINNGKATAQDIEELGEKIIEKVKDTTGIELEWEIRRFGVKDAKHSSFGGNKR